MRGPSLTLFLSAERSKLYTSKRQGETRRDCASWYPKSHLQARYDIRMHWRSNEIAIGGT